MPDFGGMLDVSKLVSRVAPDIKLEGNFRIPESDLDVDNFPEEELKEGPKPQSPKKTVCLICNWTFPSHFTPEQ